MSETAGRDTVGLLEDLLRLETAGWRSLCDGTGGAFYGALMNDGAQMVLADGQVMSRREVASSLEHAPPWASFDIEDPSVHQIADGVSALVYTGTGHRANGPSFRAVMTSVYVEESAGWKLAHYQQTPLA